MVYLVADDADAGKRVALDPNHSHFILVGSSENKKFGQELKVKDAFERALKDCKRRSLRTVSFWVSHSFVSKCGLELPTFVPKKLSKPSDLEIWEPVIGTFDSFVNELIEKVFRPNVRPYFDKNETSAAAEKTEKFLEELRKIIERSLKVSLFSFSKKFSHNHSLSVLTFSLSRLSRAFFVNFPSLKKSSNRPSPAPARSASCFA